MNLLPLLWKEVVQLRRDRFTLAMMLGIPAIQLVLFGYAIRTEVRQLPTVVLDESGTPESRALVSTLRNTGNFEIIEWVSTRSELADRIEGGRASAGLVIPRDYMRDIKRGQTASAQMIVDAADPMASAAAMSGAARAGAARAVVLSGAGDRRPTPLEVMVRPWYNPGMRDAVYIVPGIIGVLLSLTMVLITSIAIVRERERGTLEQLIVTPIDKTSLILGKIVPFLIIGFVQMSVILILGWLLFDIPVRGSLPLLYAMAFAFIVANLGIGLLMSTLVRSQLQAMQMGFLFLLPNILLSGFMFPRSAMPAPAQWLGSTLPLTYFLEVLRGVLLKGVGLRHLWQEGLILTLFAVVLVALSVNRFSKTIE